MKLSTKARYGLRAITEIAKSYGCAPAKRKDIAEKQGLSDSYLENLLIILKTFGLLRLPEAAMGDMFCADHLHRFRFLKLWKLLRDNSIWWNVFLLPKAVRNQTGVQLGRSGARCRNYGVIPYRKRPYRTCSIRKIRHGILTIASNVTDKGNNFIRNRCFENVF